MIYCFLKMPEHSVTKKPLLKGLSFLSVLSPCFLIEGKTADEK